MAVEASEAAGLIDTAAMPPATLTAATTDVSGWDFTMSGLSWWWVLPLGLVLAWLVLRLAAPEHAKLPGRTRLLVRSCRGGVAVVLMLLLIEPSCTRQHRAETPPTVAVLVDDSASMAVADPGADASRRLDEVLALGLSDDPGRDVAARQAARQIAVVRESLPQAVAVARLELADSASDASEAATAAVATWRTALAELDRLDADLAGRDGISDTWTPLRERLTVIDLAIRDDVPDDQRDQVQPALAWADDAGSELHRLERRLVANQIVTDAALINSLGPDHPLTAALTELDQQARFRRAAGLITERVVPALGEAANLRIMRLQRDLPDLDPKAIDQGSLGSLSSDTDLAGPLRDLAEQLAGEPLSSVLVVGDGRITAGGDPIPVARALQARGARLDGLVVGNPRIPRDAAVAAITGADEIYQGETIRLDVRYRVAGFPDSAWDLVLRRDGEELERRPADTSGTWRRERFSVPAEESGQQAFTARLEPSRALDISERIGGLAYQRWARPGVARVADLERSEVFEREPSASEVVSEAAIPADVGDDYVSRLRGWVVPDSGGPHVFQMTADDQAELWLGTDASPDSATLIASVNDHTEPNQWQGERNRPSAPIELRAGQAYYLEVRHREGRGGDHVAVGWQRPDGSLERPIPGDRLVPWTEGGWVEPEIAEDQPVEASLDNNQATFAVTVHEDPMRVLVVDEAPRWDSRYLVTLFDRDRRVVVDRRYRSIRQPRGEHELLPDTQEALDRYHVVVLGDLRPGELRPADQERLASFVRRRGGLLVALAGPRGMPGGYALGELADILPVTAPMGSAAPETSDDERPDRVTLRLTERGVDSSVTRVLEDEDLNLRLWPALPALSWVARSVTAKAGAEVLLETDDRAATPVLVTSRVGAGRVVYCGTDETWRWRDRLGDRVHQVFWLQVLRWGLGDRLRGGDPRLQVALDRTLAAPGDPVELRARVTLGDGSPVAQAPTVMVQALDETGAETGPVTTRELAAVPETEGIWRLAVADLPLGRYRLTTVVDHPALSDLSEVRELHIRPARGVETIDLAADPAGLARVAGAGGGGLVELDTLDEHLASLRADLEPRVETWQDTITLWDNYLVVILVTILLLIEWMVRKRHGLA